jgi:hypothetical protein
MVIHIKILKPNGSELESFDPIKIKKLHFLKILAWWISKIWQKIILYYLFACGK